ncbi:MAG: Metal chaperone, involved in Zn homeostasis [Pseudolabrys sp.]|nr:Metal chaperone, involved in Zn homeostasis [Pseudolabrys sp.]
MQGQFDGIIVETTGLAAPAPVAQAFFMDGNVGAKTNCIRCLGLEYW